MKTSSTGMAGVVLAVGVVVTGSVSCSSAPDASRSTELLQPDFKTYAENVDPYLQRRCGTLDCHGQPGRAYRLYGYTGFRLYSLDAGLVSGQQQTQPEEVLANYEAAVALEPEEMSRLIARQGEDPNRLLLLRKPLRLERHKGGPAMAEDDAGYRCVVAWLQLRMTRKAPDGVFEVIPEKERGTISARAKADCAEAQSFP